MTTISRLALEFADALREGRLLHHHCESCDRPFMYPKPRCPYCQSEKVAWRQASGAGTLVSMTIQRAAVPTDFEAQLPYALGVVRLNEGVTLLGRLAPDETGTWAAYCLDAPVTFIGYAPHPRDERVAPLFKAGEEAK